MQGDGDDESHYFFSAPASPVHYILRSPPSSTTAPAAATDADCCRATAAAGDFEFVTRDGGMSSAEELFAGGRIRVGCFSPIRQEEGRDDDGSEEAEERDGRAPPTRRARSASPPRSPLAARGVEPSDPFASASSSSSSSSSSASSSSATNTHRRISLRDLLTRTGGDTAADQAAAVPAGAAEVRSGFWPPSIWPSRSKKALLPCPAPQPGRRSTSSDRAAPAKRALGSGTAASREEARRRTTSLPYRQGLVLGCLGFGARGYELAKSMHPLYSR